MIYDHERIEALYKGALVSNEEVPLEPQVRLARIIQRVKQEYHFNQPDLQIDKDFFERIEDPNAYEIVFFDSLCNAKVKNGALDNIEMSLYGVDGYRSIFLRSCYFDMFEIILDSLSLPFPNNNRLILGSPGIGKSWFHVFCLYVLIKANAPVCLQRNNHIALYYKGELYSSQTNKKQFGNIWVLHDCNEDPVEVSPWNICIFVSSVLNKPAYKEYAKDCCFKMYMPLWNYTELVHANQVRPADRRLTEQNLLENYLLCGGIIQNIFDNFVAHKRDYELLLDNISSSDLSCIKKEEMNSRIFGIGVWKRYFSSVVEFLSKSIGRDVYQRLSEKAGISIQQLINDNSESLFVYRLKAVTYACRGLEEFGVANNTFSLQSLDDKKLDRVISFPEGLQMAYFPGLSLDNVVWEPSIPAKLWIPQFSTFPCIDGLLLLPSQKLALGLKFTMCAESSIIRESLSELIDNCESKLEGCRFAMVFVVRGSRYDMFRRQRQRLAGIRNNYGKDVSCKPSEEIPCPQYKLKMF